MLHRLRKLTTWHKEELLAQAHATLADWGETGNPTIAWNGYSHECHFGNEDDTIFVLYRCDCGEYIADYEDYTGRAADIDICLKCDAPYQPDPAPPGAVAAAEDAPCEPSL